MRLVSEQELTIDTTGVADSQSDGAGRFEIENLAETIDIGHYDGLTVAAHRRGRRGAGPRLGVAHLLGLSVLRHPPDVDARSAGDLAVIAHRRIRDDDEVRTALCCMDPII